MSGLTTVPRSAVDLAVELRDVLASHAADVERDRAADVGVLDELERRGLFATLSSAAFGGLDLPLASQLAVAAAIANGCPSTAWVQTIYACSHWWVTTLGAPAAVERVLAGPGLPRICGVLGSAGPGGRGTVVPAGYRVSGSWAFASGCTHANWALLGMEADDGTAGMALIPMAQLEVRDTWRVAGMAGTGSHTLVADGLHVDRDLVVDLGPLVSIGSAARPFPAVLAIVLLGPILGAVEAMLDAVEDGSARRGITYTSYRDQRDSQVVLRELGRARVDIAAARQLTTGLADEIDSPAVDVVDLVAERARIRAAIAAVAEQAAAVAGRLMRLGGSAAFALDNPLQRLWRDVHCAASHAFLAADPMFEQLAAVRFGRPALYEVM